MSKFAGVKLVVFDLDGTLIDAFEDIADAANYLRRLHGLSDLTVDEVKKHVGRGARVLVAGVLGTTDEALIETGYQEFVPHYQSQSSTKAFFYEGALETIASLREHGIRTAIASNKPHPVTLKMMDVMGASAYFDFIYGESSRFPRKPSPDLFLHILKEAGVTADEALMVGDTEVDIAFAHNAGVPVVAVTYGQHSEDYLRPLNPDGVIDSMAELTALVIKS